jgi:putative CocE/NonD family hydrolase
VPALTIAAWYDIFQGGSLRNYMGSRRTPATRRRAGAAPAGDHRRPCGRRPHIGAVDFGPAAAEFDENDVTLDWYDYLFLGKQNQFAGKPVRIFVMGKNEWRDEEAWPLERAKATRYLLHSVGNANSVSGDGDSRRSRARTS